ncbi:MAG: hypothetical protein K0S65_3587, partial [Labilithrix sp.]|nr:hypothetical protein [Labilithrix sp.]
GSMCALWCLAMKLSLLFAVANVSLAIGCSTTTGTSETTASGEADLTENESALVQIRDAVKDVDEEHVVFGDDVVAPSSSAGSGARSELASLYGVDWFQKWAGGRSADHGWENGSADGKRCMWASVARFEAIMKDPPPELAAFLADYNQWSGSFYNWNDDYAGTSEDGEPAFGDARGARLWAWRTGLSKWISATAKDGSCYLPTKKMLVAYVTACKEHAESNDGEMQGCEASAH